jgi:hypothetical protein
MQLVDADAVQQGSATSGAGNPHAAGDDWTGPGLTAGRSV